MQGPTLHQQAQPAGTWSRPAQRAGESQNHIGFSSTAAHRVAAPWVLHLQLSYKLSFNPTCALVPSLLTDENKNPPMRGAYFDSLRSEQGEQYVLSQLFTVICWLHTAGITAMRGLGQAAAGHTVLMHNPSIEPLATADTPARPWHPNNMHLKALPLALDQCQLLCQTLFEKHLFYNDFPPSPFQHSTLHNNTAHA